MKIKYKWENNSLHGMAGGWGDRTFHISYYTFEVTDSTGNSVGCRLLCKNSSSDINSDNFDCSCNIICNNKTKRITNGVITADDENYHFSAWSPNLACGSIWQKKKK